MQNQRDGLCLNSPVRRREVTDYFSLAELVDVFCRTIIITKVKIMIKARPSVKHPGVTNKTAATAEQRRAGQFNVLDPMTPWRLTPKASMPTKAVAVA